MHGVVKCIEDTNRNNTTNNYYTLMTLATDLKRRNLTLVHRYNEKEQNLYCTQFSGKITGEYSALPI